jgi:hypothetical protein
MFFFNPVLFIIQANINPITSLFLGAHGNGSVIMCQQSFPSPVCSVNLRTRIIPTIFSKYAYNNSLTTLKYCLFWSCVDEIPFLRRK